MDKSMEKFVKECDKIVQEFKDNNVYIPKDYVPGNPVYNIEGKLVSKGGLRLVSKEKNDV